MMWTRDSKNKLLFLERPDKYALFAHPENFLITQASSDMDREFDDEAKTTLLEVQLTKCANGVNSKCGYFQNYIYVNNHFLLPEYS